MSILQFSDCQRAVVNKYKTRVNKSFILFTFLSRHYHRESSAEA